jgi:glc operon protein GlcG
MKQGLRHRILLMPSQTKYHSMCPMGLPISLARAEAVIHAAVAEATRRNWKMNVAVADSGGHLVAFRRAICSRSMELSRLAGGIPLIDEGTIIGAIGCSGGTDSQDEIVSKAGAAAINQLQATNK